MLNSANVTNLTSFQHHPSIIQHIGDRPHSISRKIFLLLMVTLSTVLLRWWRTRRILETLISLFYWDIWRRIWMKTVRRTTTQFISNLFWSSLNYRFLYLYFLYLKHKYLNLLLMVALSCGNITHDIPEIWINIKCDSTSTQVMFLQYSLLYKDINYPYHLTFNYSWISLLL